MFSLDNILLAFVGANWMSFYIALTLLKGVALLTKNTKDDKIATLLSNLFFSVRRGKIPDDLPNLSATSKIEEDESPVLSDK